MPSKKDRTAHRLECPQCGEDLAAASFEHRPWPAKAEVFHCTGGTGFGDTSRGEAHHSSRRPLTCWNCKEVVGCNNCLPSPLVDTICAKCFVWVTLRGFLRHGPVVNDPLSVRKRGGRVAPALEEYPSRWQVEYRMNDTLTGDVQHRDLVGMSLDEMIRYIVITKAGHGTVW
jgi:hypothetical protein